jgi:short-subunit dehydrogenase
MDKITALITGASRGIGFAIAKRIAPHASRLLITSKDPERIAQAKQALEQVNSTNIVTLAADHTHPQEAATEIGNWARRHVEHLDLLVLNAGYYVEGTLPEIQSSDFEENLRVNFTVNHYLVQELLPLVSSSLLRRIVFIGSTAGYEAYPAVPSYGVAKWALRGYAANLRRELMPKNIGVTFLAPGGTLTDMWAGEEIPPNRLLDPEDAAKIVAVILTLSPQAVVEEVIFRPMLGDFHE